MKTIITCTLFAMLIMYILMQSFHKLSSKHCEHLYTKVYKCSQHSEASSDQGVLK